MNQDRMPTYIGLTYTKPKQKIVQQPIAFHLQLLKEKIKRQETFGREHPHTSLSLPSLHTSGIHNPQVCHKENHQGH
jgi:hypothetical protein